MHRTYTHIDKGRIFSRKSFAYLRLRRDICGCCFWSDEVEFTLLISRGTLVPWNQFGGWALFRWPSEREREMSSVPLTHHPSFLPCKCVCVCAMKVRVLLLKCITMCWCQKACALTCVNQFRVNMPQVRAFTPQTKHLPGKLWKHYNILIVVFFCTITTTTRCFLHLKRLPEPFPVLQQ